MSNTEAYKRQYAKVSDYKAFLKHPSGRAVLTDLIQNYLLLSGFNKDPYIHAFNEGQRDVVMRILSILKTTPEKLEKLLEGARNDDPGIF